METVVKRIHTLEHRRKDQLTGKWTRWTALPTHYLSFRVAKRERDVLVGPNGDKRDYQCRVVTFTRGRTYEAA